MADGTVIGAIIYDLNLDDSQFLAKLTAAKGQAKSFGDQLGNIGNGLNTAANAILPFSIAAGVALGVSTKAAIDFNQSMELLTSQAGASQSEVDKLKQKVLDLAPAVGAGPDQLAQGLYHIISVGFRGAEAMDILKIAAEGAAVGQANLDDTTYALTSAMATQVVGAQNASEAMGYLNAIVGAGDMRFQDLNGAISTGFLSSAKVFGLSLQSVGTALATLTDNGEPANEAATRLRMSMSLLAAPTQQAQKEFAAIGLSSTQLGADLRKPNGMMVAMDDLKAHLAKTFGPESVDQLNTYSSILKQQGADAADKYAQAAGGAANALSRMFGGGRSDAAILTLMTNTDRLSAKYTQIGEKAGSFSDSWAKQQETAAQQMKDFKAQLQVLEVQLGNAFLPTLTKLAKELGELIKWFQQLSPHTKQLITDFLLFVAVLGPVLKVGAELFKLGKIIWTVLSFLGDVLMNLIIPALDLLAATIGISLGWLIAIIAAVIAVGVAIYMIITHWSTVKKYLAQWAKDVVKFIERMWHDIAGFFERMYHDVINWVISIYNDVTGWFVSVWQDSVKFVKRMADDIVNWFKALPGRIVAMLKALPGLILKVLDAIAFLFGLYLRFWWNLFTKWIPDIVRAVIDEMMKLPGQIANIMIAVWNAVTSWLAKMWHDAVSFVTQMFNDIVGFFTRLPGEAARFFTALWNTVSAWVARMWHDSVNFVSNMFNDIVGFFSRLPGEILGFVSSMWNSANRVASGIWHGFMDTLNQLPNLISGIWDKVLDTIKHAAGKLADGAKHVASSMWNSFKDGLGIHSPSYIEHAFMNIADEGQHTVDQLHKNVGTLADLAHKANAVTSPKITSMTGGNTMAFANLAINGDINFQNQSDINYFFNKLGRNVELTQQGLTPLR